MPYVAVALQPNPFLQPNITSDIRQLNTLDAIPDGQTVLLAFRAIDGASVLPVALKTLQVRWPRLRFRLLFMANQSWVDRRTSGVQGWFHGRRINWKCYGMFELDTVVQNWKAMSDGRDIQLEDLPPHTMLEWQEGDQSRFGISYAPGSVWKGFS
jgi:hypothetical protein